MFGFILGVAATLFFVQRSKRHSSAFGHACRGPWASRWGCGSDHEDDEEGLAAWKSVSERRKSRIARWLTQALSRHIDATAEQREAVRELVECALDQRKAVANEFRGSARALADLLDNPVFDAEAMSDSFARQDIQFTSTRTELMAALERLHDQLEPEQRAKLARAIRRKL